MLKKLYVDNFKCLVNFEMTLGEVSLLLGRNGSGKTSVLAVLSIIKRFVCGEVRDVNLMLKSSSLSKWYASDEQKFEIQVQGPKGGLYHYRLVVEHDRERNRCRVTEEELKWNDKVLYESRMGDATLHRDDGSNGPPLLVDWTQSGIAMLQESPHNKKLTWFRTHLGKWVFAFIDPRHMESSSQAEDSLLAPDASNFASWYRFLVLEHPEKTSAAIKRLTEVIPGFKILKLEQFGEGVRALKAIFEGKGGAQISYGFNELSDGQRALVVLYSLVHGLGGLGYSLFLDEPDNFVELREIQPWLQDLEDASGEGIAQTVIISHHPELIDYLGADHGCWFERDAESPTRVKYDLSTGESGLQLSETIARGWQE